MAADICPQVANVNFLKSESLKKFMQAKLAAIKEENVLKNLIVALMYFHLIGKR